MTKTRRQNEADLKHEDIVVEIIDARIPVSSRNPDIDSITAGKPRLVVLNRADQADPAGNKAWGTWLRQKEPFVDDGYSGVSFNRPNFKKLEDAIRKGAIDCIVVKDLSRFSRNYIDGGRYLEKIFPQLGIRFIAVNDAYDSLTGDPQSDSFVIPFKNLINDSYCKDISMKIRSSLEVKQKNGEFVGAFAPYGYKKSPENKNQLIVDEAVSEYVQMIFSMYKDGFSIGRIAARLNQMGVLSPMEYKHSAGVKFDTVFKTGDTAKWTYKAVQRILSNEVYIGVLAQGKRGTPNYKVRVVQPKDETEWVRVEGAHEALVSYEDFMAVKTMMKRDMRCSPDQDAAHLFSGFLFCGDCQQSMTCLLYTSHSIAIISAIHSRQTAYPALIMPSSSLECA